MTDTPVPDVREIAFNAIVELQSERSHSTVPAQPSNEGDNHDAG